MNKNGWMAMQIDAAGIIKERLAASMGLDKYETIMKSVNKVNVSQDAAFQKLFNGFYLVRRDAHWRSKYYAMFEANKTRSVSFGTILTNLFIETGKIESSFSSKMVATLDPDKPIWDQYVLRTLGFKLKGKDRNEILQHAIKTYEDICNWYKAYLKTDNSRECLSVFNSAFPQYAWLSDTKKIDCFLWSTR